jgi:hypothetical protein
MNMFLLLKLGTVIVAAIVIFWYVVSFVRLIFENDVALRIDVALRDRADPFPASIDACVAGIPELVASDNIPVKVAKYFESFPQRFVLDDGVIAPKGYVRRRNSGCKRREREKEKYLAAKGRGATKSDR